jgi:5-methyltetrahydropteroyltriglutamate--homocysteine methyltransferase
MTTSHILGYPRIGEQREMKFALEGYWRNELDQKTPKKVGKEIRRQGWSLQEDQGLTYTTAGDFAWYDHVLGTSFLLGHVPKRHQKGHPDLDTLFRIGRGQSQQGCDCVGQAASDMTKWFNTNYH